jgi:predicted small secreted protein
MKRALLNVSLVVLCCVTLNSCYVYTHSVGAGAQTGVEIKKPNHYLLYGLAPVGLSDAKVMADGATDYNVTIQHTFRSLQGLRFETLRPTMDEKFKNLSVNKRMEKAERK